MAEAEERHRYHRRRTEKPHALIRAAGVAAANRTATLQQIDREAGRNGYCPFYLFSRRRASLVPAWFQKMHGEEVIRVPRARRRYLWNFADGSI